MELQVYNGEKFERGKIWHGVMGALFIVLLVATLFSAKILGKSDTWMPERTDVLSALLMFALFRGYRFYVRKETEKKIIVRIVPSEGLYIDDKLYQRHAVQGFSLEMKRKTRKLHNIIFLVNQGYEIHTFIDTEENIQNFIEQLAEYTPFQEHFTQSWFQKLLRRLKI